MAECRCGDCQCKAMKDGAMTTTNFFFTSEAERNDREANATLGKLASARWWARLWRYRAKGLRAELAALRKRCEEAEAAGPMAPTRATIAIDLDPSRPLMERLDEALDESVAALRAQVAALTKRAEEAEGRSTNLNN